MAALGMKNEKLGVKRREGECKMAVSFKELNNKCHDTGIVDGVETKKDCVSIKFSIMSRCSAACLLLDPSLPLRSVGSFGNRLLLTLLLKNKPVQAKEQELKIRSERNETKEECPTLPTIWGFAAFWWARAAGSWRA
jgi:hypothetical protein